MSASLRKTQRLVHGATAIALAGVVVTLWALRPQPEVRPRTYGEVVLEVRGLT